MHYFIALIAMSVHDVLSFDPKWHENKTSKKKYFIKDGYQPYNFSTSISFCQTYGGSIPEPRTKHEIDYLISIGVNFKSIGVIFFVGLKKKEGKWRWISDDSLKSDELEFRSLQGSQGKCMVLDNSGLHKMICWSPLIRTVVCEKCMDGYFGAMCSDECHCKDPCGRKDGKCPSACISGYSGQDCQQQALKNKPDQTSTPVTPAAANGTGCKGDGSLSEREVTIIAVCATFVVIAIAIVTCLLVWMCCCG